MPRAFPRAEEEATAATDEARIMMCEIAAEMQRCDLEKEQTNAPPLAERETRRSIASHVEVTYDLKPLSQFHAERKFQEMI